MSRGNCGIKEILALGKDDRMTQSNRTNVKGQAGVVALVIVGFTLLFAAMPASAGKEKSTVIKHEGVEIIPDFYGERMVIPSLPEEAFKISVDNGEMYGVNPYGWTN